ncbi:NAD-dependent epimerase/dehydratase family protein [Janthinobacterium sp. RB2R34]|uniref:NAD-dependent epimerase/dehydratase family protein n=1 Tax=Janthinobacterium sp. RB2R34 TaxID=3424193 RepID=UPI003F226F11
MNQIIKEDVNNILSADLPWNLFENKTVVVSGAAGFLPAYMVECLAELNRRLGNIRIIGLVRNIEKATLRLAHLLQDGVELFHHDISLPLPPDFPRADYVIHAASQASPKFYATDPVGTLKANSMGTAYLLDYAKDSKADGFLFFSSGDVYGQPVIFDQLLKETDFGYLDPIEVRSCYAESKRIGETMCASWAKQYRLHTTIVRPFHTYGPGMALDDGRVFADFVADILNNRDIHLKSDGSAIRPFCYLADATLGFFTVMLKGKSGSAYNVGNPDAETSIAQLAETLVKLFPEKKLSVVFEHRAADSVYLKSPVHRTCPSIEKANKLNWHPIFGIQDGFKRTIASFELQISEKNIKN